MYFYAGMQNDHLNVITPYLEDTYGWTTTQITNPVTFGGFVGILFYMITSTAFMKFGIRRYITGIALVIAASIMGVACSNGNYMIYFISLFVLRSVIGCLQLSGFMLCTNWFSKYRGRILGLVNSGSPLFTATGTAILTIGVESRLGLLGTYLCVGIVIAVCAVLYFVLVRDTPEEVGLKPDGKLGEDKKEEEKSIVISVKELMSYKESWLMTILFCVVQFTLIVYMAFYVANLRHVGAEQSVYLPALTIGALCAFPMGFIIGAVGDRFGSCVSALVCLTIGAIPSLVYICTTPTTLGLCILIAFGEGSVYRIRSLYHR